MATDAGSSSPSSEGSGWFPTQLPVTYLLFTTRGRITRSEYAHAAVLIVCAFYVLYTALYHTAGAWSTWLLYPLLYWSAWATACKRLHDLNRSGWWLRPLRTSPRRYANSRKTTQPSSTSSIFDPP